MSDAARSDRQTAQQLGFIGLGAMGHHMAHRLVEAGYPVAGYDPDPAALDRAAAYGLTPCQSPRAVADAASIVFLSLPAPSVVADVVVDPQAGIANGRSVRVVVDVSTTGAAVARDMAAVLDRRDIAWVDAPVSGGPAGAAAGSLTFMVSGAADAVETARPLLEHLGSSLQVVGDRPGQGQVVKVINNMMSASAITITAEALAVAVKAGLDPAVVLDVVARSSGASNAASTKFPQQVLTRRFAHGFRLALMAKDVRLCIDEARRQGVPMLLGATVEQMWTLAEHDLGPEADCSAMAQVIEEWSHTVIQGGDVDGL
jgi:3-hydroxyisobutyrate dehydrogenase-like beta-hydroxyacid dehydrogenase